MTWRSHVAEPYATVQAVATVTTAAVGATVAAAVGASVASSVGAGAAAGRERQILLTASF
jgi:hypothetical protein